MNRASYFHDRTSEMSSVVMVKLLDPLQSDVQGLFLNFTVIKVVLVNCLFPERNFLSFFYVIFKLSTELVRYHLKLLEDRLSRYFDFFF